MAAAQVLSRARQLADEVLFPSAMNVDAAEQVPSEHFDALAPAGLYELAGPAAAGGLDLDPATFCNVIEIMAGGLPGHHLRLAPAPRRSPGACGFGQLRARGRMPGAAPCRCQTSA